MPYVSDFTALTTGEMRWNEALPLGTPAVVTYTFLGSGELPSFYEEPPANPWAINHYLPMTPSQRQAVRKALDHYEAVTGLVFVEVDDPSNASIQFMANRSDDYYLTSWANFPQTYGPASEVSLGSVTVIMTFDPAYSPSLDWSSGSVMYSVVLHEIGHAVGLEHPHDGYDNVFLVGSKDNHDFTIMSYNSNWSGGTTGRARDTLAPLDLDALHYLYGNQSGFTARWNASGDFLVIDGARGNDQIMAGRAPSLMLGGEGNDRLTGVQFDDTLLGGNGHDWLDGAGGDDRLVGGAGSDRMFGGSGSDALNGQAGADVIRGEAGDDRIIGGAGADRLNGGGHNDTVSGGAGFDTIHGEWGDDLLRGGDYSDTLFGGAGRDMLNGQNGDDLLYGGDGDDHLIGEAGRDRLEGGTGHDVLEGRLGSDFLFGRAGNDRLNGGSDNDLLVGGPGQDTLSGGSGEDVFMFAKGAGVDTITDFQDGLDQINLRWFDGVDSFADVQGVTRQVGNDLVIDLDGSTRIILQDMSLSQLDASDFIF